MSDGKGKSKVTPAQEAITEEISRVHNLIENCMLHCMNKKEVSDLLYAQQKIEPSFTNLIWEELEKQNKEFFENYNSRLIMKEANEKQAARVNELMKNTVNSVPESSGSNAAPRMQHVF